MSSMLDVVLSLIIGGMLMLSMLTAMTTIQSHAINQQIHYNLIKNSQNIGNILEGYYLARLGVNHSGTPITTADTKRMRFWTYITDPSTGTETDMDVTIAETTNSSGEKFLLVYRDNDPSKKLFGPFALSPDGLTINYYDVYDVLSTSAFLSPDEVAAVEIGFHTKREGINLSGNYALLDITNYVYLKKYLINCYK